MCLNVALCNVVFHTGGCVAMATTTSQCSEWLQTASLCIQKGFMLADHALVTHRVRSFMDCTRQCLQRPACLSVNYWAYDMSCAMNGHVVWYPDSLDEAPGCWHGVVARPVC